MTQQQSSAQLYDHPSSTDSGNEGLQYSSCDSDGDAVMSADNQVNAVERAQQQQADTPASQDDSINAQVCWHECVIVLLCCSYDVS